MSEKEKDTLTKIAEAFKMLTPEKKERWIGYAEGVLDATERRHQEPQQASA